MNSEKEKLYYYRKGLNPHIKLKFGGIESNMLRVLVDRVSLMSPSVAVIARGSVSLMSPSVAVIARGSTEMHYPGNALTITGMTTLDQVGVVEATPPNTPALLRIVTPGTVMLRTTTFRIVSTVPVL